jgi:hypothetical protein
MIWALLLWLNYTVPCVLSSACYCAMLTLDDAFLAARDVVVGRVLRVRMVSGPTGDPEQEAVMVVRAT